MDEELFQYNLMPDPDDLIGDATNIFTQLPDVVEGNYLYSGEDHGGDYNDMEVLSERSRALQQILSSLQNGSTAGMVHTIPLLSPKFFRSFRSSRN